MRVEYKKDITDKILGAVCEAANLGKEIECIYLTYSEIHEIARIYNDPKAKDIIHTDKEYLLRDFLIPIRQEY